jgi:nicotinamide-nucleotide amidase
LSAAELVRILTDKKLMVATAESCTGGLVAAAITDIAGSSAVLDRGFVTYSNAAKTEMLGVAAELIEAHGAVSAEVARAMAEGALRKSHANIAVAVTGVAGPAGGSVLKPVGLVHFACATAEKTVHLEKRYRDLGRDRIRAAAVDAALQLILDCV